MGSGTIASSVGQVGSAVRAFDLPGSMTVTVTTNDGGGVGAGNGSGSSGGMMIRPSPPPAQPPPAPASTTMPPPPGALEHQHQQAVSTSSSLAAGRGPTGSRGWVSGGSNSAEGPAGGFSTATSVVAMSPLPSQAYLGVTLGSRGRGDGGPLSSSSGIPWGVLSSGLGATSALPPWITTGGDSGGGSSFNAAGGVLQIPPPRLLPLGGTRHHSFLTMAPAPPLSSSFNYSSPAPLFDPSGSFPEGAVVAPTIGSSGAINPGIDAVAVEPAFTVEALLLLHQSHHHVGGGGQQQGAAPLTANGSALPAPPRGLGAEEGSDPGQGDPRTVSIPRAN